MAAKKEIITKFKQEKLEKGKFSFKIEAREEQIYANSQTIEGFSMKDIPRDNLFISESNHFFNIDEMVKHNTLLVNPWNQQPFTHNDLIKLRKYPKVSQHFKTLIQEVESQFSSSELSQQHIQEIKSVLMKNNSNPEMLDKLEKYQQYRKIIAQTQEITHESIKKSSI